MSDTAINGSLDAFLLDGDAPRLGATTPLPPAPSILDYEQLANEPGVFAAPPAAGSMLTPPRLDAAPVLLALDGPSLPTSAPKAPAAPSADTPSTGDQSEQPAHPMAHLMPGKTQQNESSVWAAQLRAAKKKKARRIKIIAAVVFLAIAALVGPPLGKWLVNAINESGKTSTDEPAATVPAGPATTAPAASATTAPPATGSTPATSAPTGLLGLPGQATATVEQVNGATATTPPAPPAAPAAVAATVAP